MDDPHRNGRKHLHMLAVLVLAGASTACDVNAVSGNGTAAGVFYALGDDHRLYRWDAAAEDTEPVLDLSGAWEGEGDVGTVLRMPDVMATTEPPPPRSIRGAAARVSATSE